MSRARSGPGVRSAAGEAQAARPARASDTAPPPFYKILPMNAKSR